MAGATSEMDKIIRKAKKRGWSAEKTGGGHWRLTSPGGVRVIASTSPGSSSYIRNIRGKIAQVERREHGRASA